MLIPVFTSCGLTIFFVNPAISHVFHGPEISQSRLSKVQVFQGLGFLGFKFSGSSFFRVQFFLDPGPGSRSGTWVQVLRVAQLNTCLFSKPDSYWWMVGGCIWLWVVVGGGIV